MTLLISRTRCGAFLEQMTDVACAMQQALLLDGQHTKQK